MFHDLTRRKQRVESDVSGRTAAASSRQAVPGYRETQYLEDHADRDGGKTGMQLPNWLLLELARPHAGTLPALSRDMTTSMRIEASYAALTDSKGRSVRGYAIITEELRGTEPPAFVVKTYATRDGKQFGASSPRGTRYPDYAAAVAGAHKALAAQGKRYQKTFGGAA